MDRIFSVISCIDRVITFFIKPIVVFVSLAIAFMLAIGIFSRSVIEKPVFGLEELVLIGAMWLYMLGAALASRERSHLSADFIQVICSNQKVIKAIHLVAGLVSLVMAIMFVSWSFDLLLWGVEKGQTTPVFQLPWYLSQSSLFVASLLFVFYLVRDLLKDLSKFNESN